MRQYQIEEHTADVRLGVTADSLEELFTVALEGIGDLFLTPQSTNSNQIELCESISLSADDPTALLIDFLSEVLSLSHCENAVFREVEFSEITPTELSATVTGFAVDHFDRDVKAVTYHEAEVVQDEDGVFATVIVLDI